MNKLFKILSNIYNVQVKTLKHDFGTAKKYRIIHISDFHIGNFDADHINYIVDILNSIDCDFITFTGDIVCDKHEELTTERLNALSRIQHTVYAILGNHDYNLYTKSTKRQIIKSFRTVLQKLSDIGWIYLINENTTYEELQIIGTDDNGDDKWSMTRGDIDRAYVGTEDTLASIVLTHNPTYVDEIIDKYEPELVLCGHTHAGQIGFQFKMFNKTFSWSFASKYKYWLDTYYRKSSTIHVNRGLGYDILPLRTFAPEITVHEIF